MWSSVAAAELHGRLLGVNLWVHCVQGRRLCAHVSMCCLWLSASEAHSELSLCVVRTEGMLLHYRLLHSMILSWPNKMHLCLSLRVWRCAPTDVQRAVDLVAWMLVSLVHQLEAGS